MWDALKHNSTDINCKNCSAYPDPNDFYDCAAWCNTERNTQTTDRMAEYSSALDDNTDPDSAECASALSNLNVLVLDSFAKNDGTDRLTE